ncbi:cellulase family glycosylhydrolase [Vibrio zhugei]|uniref:Endoglucanase n=1 Tax=Vibrio zhugei TaxID=2479546 RepID=A0ABV7C949_9VIBR
MNVAKVITIKALTLAITMACGSAFAAVPALTTNGSQILSGGDVKSFSGNSFFWSNTGWKQEKMYNAKVVKWLKDDWKSSIVRVALGVDNDGSYIEDPTGNVQRIEKVIDAAIANDMYVIIDFHSHHAEDHQQEAIEFFTQMAQKYGQTNNVIYEIYNEPLQVSWSGVIKPYAEAVIAAIRAIDPDNLIVVGTPNWSQDVDEASRDPINDVNVAYTLHFYAGTHRQYFRDKAITALNNGVPLMVTEWGTVNANGDGGVDAQSTDEWVDFMRTNHITNLNWAVSDKDEGASIIKPGVSPTGNWSDSDLTASGRYVRDIVRSWGTSADAGTGGDDSGAFSCVFTQGNTWNGGFQGSITVTNESKYPVSDWAIRWQFASGATVTNSWNANVTGSGVYTATPISWNQTMQPNQTFDIGLVVQGTGEPTILSDICR